MASLHFATWWSNNGAMRKCHLLMLWLLVGAPCLSILSPHVASAAPPANDVKLGDLYLQVLSTQDLVGYNASLPYIRKGDVQWQAIGHVFTVENEVDHFRFLMKVQNSLVVYNISAELTQKSSAKRPSLYFADPSTPPDKTQKPPQYKGPLAPLTGNLGYNQENKTRRVDIVALCDPSDQTGHNATLEVQINFMFRLLSSSTQAQPIQSTVVPITVIRRKKCYLSSGTGDKPGGPGSNRTSTIGTEATTGDIFDSTSSSSIFFVSIGISLGVIVIICIVVAFYHITTFRPQQRKNKCYSELPFTDPRGQGHVPMFMPKNMNGLQPTSSANNPNAIQMVNNPNPHMHRQLQHQQGLDSNTMFMLNQSKISDGSDQSQTRIANQSPVNSLYQQPVLPSSCRQQQPSAVYNGYNGGQASLCFMQPQNGCNTSTPVDIRGGSYNQSLGAIDDNTPDASNNEDIVISRDVVTFQNIIQEGTFGKLCHGFVTLQKRDCLLPSNQMDQRQQQATPTTMEVFIKTVSLTSSVGQVELMLAEGFKYRGVSNKYILSVAAVVPPSFSSSSSTSAVNTNSQQLLSAPPMLVYPYSANGNLKLFLKNLRESHQPLTTRDVVGMALQIGKAVQYLDKKRMTVGDVATRNCVVDERLNVKITDNALARDIFPNDYNCLGDERNRPVKWLSPESLAFYLTEPAGDIWSFGVTIWELLTLAQQPYLETDPFEMLAFLKKGNRLYQPLNCPDELYRLMESCWCYDSEERPKINKLITYLVDFNKTLGAYI